MRVAACSGVIVLLIGSDGGKWTVHFEGGASELYAFDAGGCVRCVRNPTTPPPQGARYEVRNGVAHDLRTGLDWQQTSMPQRLDWQQAKTYCAGLTLEGQGWRLPAAKELLTLVDPRSFDPAIDRKTFPDVATNVPEPPPQEFPILSTFWASSQRSGEVWVVDFRDGHSGTTTTTQHYARCVR